MEAAALSFETVRTARDREDLFGQVVRERENQVLRTAFRILGNWADAEEVAQDVFFRLHRHGTAFETDAAANAWIYRVTVNLCLDRRRAVRPTCELPELRCDRSSAEVDAIRGERKQMLMRALDELPAKERAAVVLREIEGLSTSEVAAALGSTEGTVRSQISKATVKLREIMQRERNHD